MPEDRESRVVGYSLNCFPYHTLEEMWTCLETDVLRLKARSFPHSVFPIELRVSDPIVRQLTDAPDETKRLKAFLDSHQLGLVTLNAFVMPAFHGQPVKQRVYLPAWHESNARLKFTNKALDLMVSLAPDPQVFGTVPPTYSISVPFGALKPVSMEAVAPHITAAGEHAAQIHAQTGIHCAVALEPEPGLCVETTDEVLEFFETFVPQTLRPYLTVNFDLCHQLVQFEDPVAAVQALQVAGIRITKVHVTNAADMPEWLPFYEDSIYLHQTVGIDAHGRRVYFSIDRPEAPLPKNVARVRCHYHLPVCDRVDSPVSTTLDEVARFLQINPLAMEVPYVIETYTWPQQLRGRDQLITNIAGELDWVRSKIGLSDPSIPL